MHEKVQVDDILKVLLMRRFIGNYIDVNITETGLALPLYPAQPALLSDTAALCAGEPLHVISIAIFRTVTAITFITMVHCENITIIIITITIISISAQKHPQE